MRASTHHVPSALPHRADDTLLCDVCSARLLQISSSSGAMAQAMRRRSGSPACPPALPRTCPREWRLGIHRPRRQSSFFSIVQYCDAGSALRAQQGYGKRL